MKAIPKTEACIRMLGEAKLALNNDYDPHQRPSDKTPGGYFDKPHTVDFLNRIKAMLTYRLLPMGVISIPADMDKETARANLQHIEDFEAFWYVMKNYELVTPGDLKNEFWELLPDLKAIPEYIVAFNAKFDDVNYSYDTDVAIIKEHYSGLRKLVEAGKLSADEADEIYYSLSFIAERYNEVFFVIREIYREFRALQGLGDENNSLRNESKPPNESETHVAAGTPAADPSQQITFDDIFHDQSARDKCLQLLDYVEITINGKPNNLTKGRAGMVGGALIAMKEKLHFFKTDFTEAQLLEYFNRHLSTKYKSFSKKSRKYESSYDDAKRFLKG